VPFSSEERCYHRTTAPTPIMRGCMMLFGFSYDALRKFVDT
jgi:hypothetical protein